VVAPRGIYAVEHVPPGITPPEPVVVLVHGTMDRSASFARVVRDLRGHSVLTYDRRGYGRSLDAAPPATSLADHVADLVALLDGRRAVVIGHSYGGDVALGTSVSHPGLVTAVGAFEPPTPWLPWWPRGSDRGDVLDVLSATPPGDGAEWFFRRLVGDDQWNDLPERTKQRRRAEAPALLGDVRSIQPGRAPFTLDELRAVLGRGTPVHIGAGRDSAAYHREGAARLAAELGAALTWIPSAGHDAHASHAGPFARWVRTVAVAGLRFDDRTAEGG